MPTDGALLSQAVASPAGVDDQLRALGEQAQSGLVSGNPALAADKAVQALALKPDWAVGHNLLGIAKLQLGQRREARVSFEAALRMSPRFVGALSNLANLSLEDGNADDAESLFRQALDIDGSAAFAWIGLGNALALGNRNAEARACFERAVAINPQSAEAHNRLGALFSAERNVEEARRAFGAALQARPDYPDTLVNLAELLIDDGDLQGADQLCQAALARNPRHVEGKVALAKIEGKRGETKSACDRLEEVLAAQPGHVGARLALGNILQQAGDVQSAESQYRTLVAANPSNAIAEYNLAMTLLLKGDHVEGFHRFESRFRAFPNAYPMLDTKRAGALLGTAKRWSGEDLHGQSILVWAEQGLGDSLMMMRYIPRLKERGAGPVTVLCDPSVRRVLASVDGVDQVETFDSLKNPTGAAWHVPMMSLPAALGTIDAPIAPNAGLARLSGVVANAGGQRAKRRVGIAWAGSPSLRDDACRSVPLVQWRPILEVPGVEFVSLQHGPARDQLTSFNGAVTDTMQGVSDFMDTATIVAALDLVISVDTAVAHLSGVLGRPTWLLNRHGSEWRWGIGKDTTEWYPSMRIFRQREHDDWSHVIRDIADELRMQNP